jgi:hypothetical protein
MMGNTLVTRCQVTEELSSRPFGRPISTSNSVTSKVTEYLGQREDNIKSQNSVYRSERPIPIFLRVPNKTLQTY